MGKFQYFSYEGYENKGFSLVVGRDENFWALMFLFIVFLSLKDVFEVFSLLFWIIVLLTLH